MVDIVIAAAARTPVGSFNGAFAAVPAHELGKAAITAALTRAKVDAGDVSEVVLGQVLTANQGMNPARQASRAAGVPDAAPAWSLNQVCGSGLRAVVVGYQQILAGDASIVVAGGQENMSLSPHAAHLRAGQKMGGLEFSDTMIKDGLTDVFNAYHMGVTAENVAEKWQISRDEQDAFATASQHKASAAQKAGKFKDEIIEVTVKGRKGETIVGDDEYIKHDATVEGAGKLRPAFK
jgi:acetyl-CoA C-acetyltransferase